MAVIPLVTGPNSPSGAGSIAQPGLPEQRVGIRGTAAGQGGFTAQALGSLGQDLGQASRIAGQQVLQDQALSNEAMARDADATGATTMANIYNEYAVLEGEKAVAAKDTYMAKMNDARAAALATMPNPEAKRMLDSVLTRRLGFYQEGIGRYAAGEQKKWQLRSAEGSATMNVNQASVFRNVPDLVEANIEAGVANVANVAEMRGWDKDTTQTQVLAFRGGAYDKIIHQLLADGKTDAAMAMFERNRDKMDATSAARISQTLKPIVQRQQDGQAVARSAPPGAMGGATASNIADAIHMQESGGKATSAASVDGARGGWQITPDTFKLHAQPGENIDNPTDNEAVGRRIIGKYEQDYAGDPARVAVAYFSGPGNVAPPGSPTPWKEDRKDGNGKSVSSYVADVTKRLRADGTAPPEYEAPDFDAWREQVRADSGDDFETQVRRVSMVNQREAQWKSETNVARQDMQHRLTDVSAALADGRPVAIPEQQIRALYPKAQATEIIGKLDDIRQGGIAMGTVRFASPGDFKTMLDQYADVGPAPPGADASMQAGYAQRDKIRTGLTTAWQRSREQLAKDPAGYVAQSPAVAPLATPEALAQPGGPEQYARASIAEQARLGVAEPDRRVIGKEQAAALVDKLVTADPETTPIYAVLGQMQKDYGDMMPYVWRDMVRGGLPKEYAVLGSMTAPGQVGARGDVQKMLSLAAKKGGMAELHKSVQAMGTSTSKPAKDIDDGLGDALAPFQESTRFSGGPDLYETVHDAVKNLAYYYAFQGAKAPDAIRQAVSGVLDARYDFDGTMRVPKGQMPLAREVTQGVQARLTADDLAPVAGGPLAGGERSRLLDVAKRGFWTPNANDDGLVLMGTYQNIGAGVPVRMPIKRADGHNVEIKFSDMDAMRNGFRGSPVASGRAATASQDAELAGVQPR